MDVVRVLNDMTDVCTLLDDIGDFFLAHNDEFGARIFYCGRVIVETQLKKEKEVENNCTVH